MATKAKDSGVIEVLEVKREVIQVNILGVSPMIQNRLPEKARQELLLPAAPKNKADKASKVKHDPLSEYRSSIHRIRGDEAPTLVGMPATAFKAALATAALDVPGAVKTQIGRLVYVEGETIPIYGVPQLLMSVVRCANINRTPDIRTRAILPSWACSLSINYPPSLIKPQAIINLLAAAGMSVGVGDYRAEKGKGNFGSFTLVPGDDVKWEHIAATGGRQAQIEAMENPEPYDDDTIDLLDWFGDEASKRGIKVAA